MHESCSSALGDISSANASHCNQHPPASDPQGVSWIFNPETSHLEGNKKLAVIRVFALVRHAQQPQLVMAHERFVVELRLDQEEIMLKINENKTMKYVLYARQI